jgi:hypothetical protein
MPYKNKNHPEFELFTLCVYLFGGVDFFINSRYAPLNRYFKKNAAKKIHH